MVKDLMAEMKEWLVEHRREVIIFLLVFLVSSLSFGLGYLVNREWNRAPIIIEKRSEG